MVPGFQQDCAENEPAGISTIPFWKLWRRSRIPSIK